MQHISLPKLIVAVLVCQQNLSECVQKYGWQLNEQGTDTISSLQQHQTKALCSAEIGKKKKKKECLEQKKHAAGHQEIR